MPFSTVYGHVAPVRILTAMLKSGQIPHAFIFEGKEGVGKRTLAVAFVKALNCTEKEYDFCDMCVSCRKIESAVHPDVFFLEPEKNVIKIEQVRALQQEISFKASEAIHKAVIVDMADKLNVHAANSFLKTLEEPPDDTVLILVVSSTAEMLPTILSRCQRIVFSPLEDNHVMKFLVDRGVEKDRAEGIVQHAGGSISKALSLLESSFFARRIEAAMLLAELSGEEFDPVFKITAIANDCSDELPLVLEFFHTFYRDVFFLREGVLESFLYNKDMTDILYEVAGHETRQSLMRKIKRIQWLRQISQIGGMDVQLGLESMFMPDC